MVVKKICKVPKKYNVKATSERGEKGHVRCLEEKVRCGDPKDHGASKDRLAEECERQRVSYVQKGTVNITVTIPWIKSVRGHLGAICHLPGITTFHKSATQRPVSS